MLQFNENIVTTVKFLKDEDGTFVSAVLTYLKPLIHLPDTEVYSQVGA
jgi:hypothetical protein